MELKESALTLSDGRVLEYATLGRPSRSVVFFHHGTPGSTRLVRSFEAIADAGGFYFVTLSRGGYGASTRREGRDVASVVTDVAAVLDELSLERYVALGWSGGGPHALACASLDSRCARAVTLASVAPPDVDVDFDWMAGMGPENLEEFALARTGGAEYEAHMEAAGGVFGAASADNVIELFGGLLSDADKAVLVDVKTRQLLAEAMVHSFAGGWRGFYDDDQAILAPWGFTMADVKVPVDLFFGDQDLMVPSTHGRWLAEQLSNATVHHHGAEGHLSIFANHVDEVATAIARAFE